MVSDSRLASAERTNSLDSHSRWDILVIVAQAVRIGGAFSAGRTNALD